MFEWKAASQAVTDGTVSPLALVRELEPLGALELLSLGADTALAVVEIVQAVTSSLSALAVEALTRRECERVARERDDLRSAGSMTRPAT